MATIVLHTPSNTRWVLLGANFVEGRMPANMFDMENVGTKIYGMVAVCDLNGKVGFLRHEDVVVVSIDGQAPASLLKR